MPDQQQIAQLVEEINNCLLLNNEEKKKWAELADKIPDEIFKKVFVAIKSKNRITEKYLAAGIEAEQGKPLQQQLNSRIAKMKKDAFEIEDRSSATNADNFLDNSLQ